MIWSPLWTRKRAKRTRTTMGRPICPNCGKLKKVEPCHCGYREHVVHFLGNTIHSPGPGCTPECRQRAVCDTRFLQMARTWRKMSDANLRDCRMAIRRLIKELERRWGTCKTALKVKGIVDGLGPDQD